MGFVKLIKVVQGTTFRTLRNYKGEPPVKIHERNMKRKVMIILYKYKKNSKRAEERRLAKAFKIINFRKLKLIFTLIRKNSFQSADRESLFSFGQR